MAEVGTNKCIGFEVFANNALTVRGRLYVPKDESIRNELLEEAHFIPYAAYPGGIKITSKVIKTAKIIGYSRMEVTTYSDGLRSRSSEISKREIVRLHGVPFTIDLNRDPSWETHLTLMEYAYDNSFQATIGMALYKVLYDRKYRSPIHWDEVRKNRILDPEINERTIKAIDKIRAKIKKALDQQKSYADVRRKDFEFSVEDKVFLKVTPMKGSLRFGKKGKLTSRFIGSFEILERIDAVTYRLALSPKLTVVHHAFHVSMLGKYVHDPNRVVRLGHWSIGDEVQLLGQDLWD
ncbi:uncharacterized protein LOC111392066 [Olea europaea var. sylvestris]|uniref:uncharacterized protein LOC111392066 n=1 Tax=Olea europaea var. sylvestris TaxID=158386 RepID=UPI000C1D3F93|nr:uncharacterized protein LOC111392066 [Olea europaea var. sylvestris]